MVLVAVWLTALVPTVSRTVDWLAVADLGAGCDTMPASHHGMSHGEMDHDAMSHAAMGHATGGHDACDPDAACGYCTLFAQLPAVAGAVFIGHPLLAVPHVPAPLPEIRAGPSVALVHAPPRGPPVVAHA